MKYRHFLFLIFGLLALVFIWKYKSREIVVIAREGQNQRKRDLKFINKQINFHEIDSSIIPTSEKSFTDTAPKLKKPKKLCFEKIIDHYKINPEYLAESRQRLNNVVGDWYYTKNNSLPKSINESSTQGKFLLALAKADLMSGLSLEQDEVTALSLLSEVAASDPQNSAPFLFAAIIELKRGNREHAEELLKETNQSQYFNSYLKDFIFAVYDGVQSPSDLLAAIEIWSTTPIPNYMALREILEMYKLPKIAFQLVNDGLQSKPEIITDLDWISVEYAVGKKLLDSYEMGTNLPEYRDLLKEHSRGLGEVAERTVSNLDSTCDLEFIKSEVEVIRDYLNKVAR